MLPADVGLYFLFLDPWFGFLKRNGEGRVLFIMTH